MSAESTAPPRPASTEIAIARQAIHDRWTRVVGYELLFRGGAQEEEERAAASVIVETFTGLGIDAVVGRRPAHVRVSRRFLLELHAFALPADRVVLEISAHDAADPALQAVLERLAAERYRVSLACAADAPPPPAVAPLADSVKLDVRGLSEPQIAACAEVLAPIARTLIATGVDTPAQLEQCRDAGFHHFQGFFFCTPDVVSGEAPPTGRMAELRSLAGLYASSITFEELEAVIARDVGLSYRLLCYLNSAFFNLPRRVASVREALVLLGMRAVRRWATLMALSGAEDRPHELTVTALLRGRFCELIGHGHGAEDLDAYFTVGLFSVMDAIAGAPLEQALEALPLTEEAHAALLERRGSMGDALAAVQAYERGEVALAAEHAPGLPLGVLYLDALAWADAASGALGEGGEPTP
jgi:c-di-GMP phosphodiesterase